jgi:hypothetical protein
MADTQWFWKGKWLEYCSCDWGCPCESNAPPSRGHCDGVVAMHIDEGNYGDVKLDGITGESAVAGWPGSPSSRLSGSRPRRARAVPPAPAPAAAT